MIMQLSSPWPWRLVGVRAEKARLPRRLCWKRFFVAATHDSSFVDARHAPSDFDPISAVVYKDFISEREGESLVDDITARMKRYVDREETQSLIASRSDSLISTSISFSLVEDMKRDTGTQSLRVTKKSSCWIKSRLLWNHKMSLSESDSSSLRHNMSMEKQ